MGKKVLDRTTLKKVLSQQRLHPSVPDIVVAIINLTSSPSTSINDLVKVIEKDQELSTRILEIANSGFYSFKRKITSITDAVILLGWNTVKMISLGSTVLKRISEKDSKLYGHCMRTALIARFLAIEANFYKVEEIAVVGLLHDLGIIILELYFNEEFLISKQYALDNSVPIHIAERKLLGVDHAEIGGWTLAEWQLPENIIESVARHHSFDPDTYHARKTAVIHMADILAMAVDFAGPSWEKVPEMALSALEMLGFHEADLKDLILTCMRMKFDPLIL